jgi:hypothetical protein
VAKPRAEPSHWEPATYYWLGSAIEPSLGGATGSRAGAEPSRTVATLIETRLMMDMCYALVLSWYALTYLYLYSASICISGRAFRATGLTNGTCRYLDT